MIEWLVVVVFCWTSCLFILVCADQFIHVVLSYLSPNSNSRCTCGEMCSNKRFQQVSADEQVRHRRIIRATWHKCWGWGVTCDGLASHPGTVAILLVASFCGDQDKQQKYFCGVKVCTRAEVVGFQIQPHTVYIKRLLKFYLDSVILLNVNNNYYYLLLFSRAVKLKLKFWKQRTKAGVWELLKILKRKSILLLLILHMYMSEVRSNNLSVIL